MKLLSLDVETSGLDPAFALQPWRVRQRKAWLTTIAWTRRDARNMLDTQGVILQQGTTVDFDNTTRVLRAILSKAIESKMTCVAWNSTFDVAWLLAYGLDDLVFQLPWMDAMHVWRHLDIEPTFRGKKSYSLDAANKAFEPAFMNYKKEGHLLFHDTAPESRQRLLAYNKSDSRVELLHFERLWPQLTERQQRAALIESACIPHVARSNITGMKVDVTAREQLAHTLAVAGHEIARTMAPLGVTEVILRSPAKTATLLFKKWGLPIVKMNVNGKGEETGPSTDKEVLHELAIDDERVLKIGMWREAINLRTKFMGGLQESIEYSDEGDRTYPQATMFGTYSGRMTYTSKQGRGVNEKPVGFALHQMKNDPRFRDCIIAFEGHQIVEFDASGQEFRLAAIQSGDPVMLDLCMPGSDPHSYMAARIHNMDYHVLKRAYEADDKEATIKRKLGKVSNLALQYRTSRKRLRIVSRVQYNIPMSEEEAAHNWSTYRRSYVGMPMYWKRQIMLGRQLGYAETLAGRRVKVDGDWTGDYQWGMEQTMINYPIQGTGGDQKYLAIQCLGNILNQFDARFAWDLHDGLFFYVPDAKAEAFAVKGKHVLDNLPYTEAWGVKLPIAMPFDCKMGRSWGALKGVRV